MALEELVLVGLESLAADGPCVGCKDLDAAVLDAVLDLGKLVCGALGSDLFVELGQSNAAGGQGALIYIEGNIKPDDIMKLCYTR